MAQPAEKNDTKKRPHGASEQTDEAKRMRTYRTKIPLSVLSVDHTDFLSHVKSLTADAVSRLAGRVLYYKAHRRKMERKRKMIEAADPRLDIQFEDGMQLLLSTLAVPLTALYSHAVAHNVEPSIAKTKEEKKREREEAKANKPKKRAIKKKITAKPAKVRSPSPSSSSSSSSSSSDDSSDSSDSSSSSSSDSDSDSDSGSDSEQQTKKHSKHHSTKQPKQADKKKAPVKKAAAKRPQKAVSVKKEKIGKKN